MTFLEALRENEQTGASIRRRAWPQRVAIRFSLGKFVVCEKGPRYGNYLHDWRINSEDVGATDWEVCR